MSTPWFRWFAWRPTWTYDRGWTWLRYVWRRHNPPKDIPGIPTCWTWDMQVADPNTPVARRIDSGWEITVKGVPIAHVADGVVDA